MLTPIELAKFGGLNLAADPQELGFSGAVDLYNVNLDAEGRLRTRPGYELYYTEPAGGLLEYWNMALFRDTALSHLVLAGVGSASNPCLTAINAGGSVNSANATGDQDWSFAEIGTPTRSRLYCCTNSGSVWYLDGGTSFVTAAAQTYTPSAVGVMPADNRLVIAGGSRVRFSDPGDPETFGANNYVDLTPGDGENIDAIGTWRDLVFAFKRSKFFVFYGNSVDATGEPIFNYRTVDTKVGLGWNSTGAAVCSGPDGLYFVSNYGVYRTTGDAPVRVSDALQPFFDASLPAPYWTEGTCVANVQQTRIFWFNGQLYVNLRTSSTDAGRTFVHDPKADLWSMWNLSIYGFEGDKATFWDKLYIIPAGTTTVCRMDSTLTTDAGTSFTGAYRTGFWNPGEPGGESVIREWLLDGTGTVSVATAVNDAATLGDAASVTLGAGPVIAQGRDRRAVRGRNVSMQISGTAPWSVSRVVANVRSRRSSGEQAA